MLSGCTGARETVGPDTGIPPFDLDVSPPIITPSTNAVLSLIQTLPLDFQQLDNKWALFSSDSQYGGFTPFANVHVDIAANGQGYLDPQPWFFYAGPNPPDTLDVIIYAHVATDLGDTLAWNSCIIQVVSD
ncbi:hypothetical protein CEE37_09820 [candidate division LCP-89 bacterium B3_LCP]|uniref:Uncharacterized protein n=1 Tax=candidate division LCP-89 bacterium B3_LCP TaxID=2012998 RepID=A0A532UYI3_UNCL8|nr:MAG: hypothetical protein CEE37_09820 [candidate division LCP-89 bacterium B3_LCP]